MNRNRKTKQILLGAVVVAGVLLISGSDANADYVFGTPTNLGPTINSSQNDIGPSISADGLQLYFERDGDIWVATRPTTEDDWAAPVSLGPTVNTSAVECFPSISGDGLELYFCDHPSGLQPGGFGSVDIWVTTRADVSDAWGIPENLGPVVNSSSLEGMPSISADGLSLFFTFEPSGEGSGNWDICMTSRATTDADWGAPVNLGPPVNTSAMECWPGISADALMVLFGSNRSGGSGSHDLWLARRPTIDDPWQEAINLGPVVNSSAWDSTANLSADGSTLYFVSNRDGGHGGFDLWQVSISPVVDFNNDGNVDLKDVGMLLMLGWGTDNARYDIGPMPWGDGIVDGKDLMVLAEHGAILAGDANYDGVVDFFDLAEVAKNWLRQQP